MYVIHTVRGENKNEPSPQTTALRPILLAKTPIAKKYTNIETIAKPIKYTEFDGTGSSECAGGANTTLSINPT